MQLDIKMLTVLTNVVAFVYLLLSAFFTFLGICFTLAMCFLMFERISPGSLHFFSFHGSVDIEGIAKNFLQLAGFAFAIVLGLGSFFKIQLEKVFGTIGLLGFFLVAVPMSFSLEAMRGMMWQMTSLTILSDSFVIPAIIFVSVFLLIFWLYRPLTLKQFVGVVSHG